MVLFGRKCVLLRLAYGGNRTEILIDSVARINERETAHFFANRLLEQKLCSYPFVYAGNPNRDSAARINERETVHFFCKHIIGTKNVQFPFRLCGRPNRDI